MGTYPAFPLANNLTPEFPELPDSLLASPLGLSQACVMGSREHCSEAQ